jgi:hypothetical protein
MAPARDVRQWKQACAEVGLDPNEKHRATREFHEEKRASGNRRHMAYGDLIIWLQTWREDQCRRP